MVFLKKLSSVALVLITSFTANCPVCAAQAHLRTASPINARSDNGSLGSMLVTNFFALSLTIPLIVISRPPHSLMISVVAAASVVPFWSSTTLNPATRRPFGLTRMYEYV